MERYRLLIVDDEKIERDGIAYLVQHLHYPVDIVEAQNGEHALTRLQEQPIDILLTDIKMPFMDGLALAEAVKDVYPRIKIVIFSAYGEFDYARQALRASVINYVLKPIDVDEFQRVMDEVIASCDRDRQQDEEYRRIEEGYLKRIHYEKWKVLNDLVHDHIPSENCEQQLLSVGVRFQGSWIVVALLDLKERFFDTRAELFEAWLSGLLVNEYEYLNLNERQSLLVLHHFEREPKRTDLEQIGSLLVREMDKDFQCKPVVIFSPLLSDASQIAPGFTAIEKALDRKFYSDDGALLFAEHGESVALVTPEQGYDQLLKDIELGIQAGDFSYAAESIDTLFNSLKANDNLSPFYVKFICAAILQKIYAKLDTADQQPFATMLDTLFMSGNLAKLKEDMLNMVLRLRLNSTDHGSGSSSSRSIRQALAYIHKYYGKDLSLEAIAEHVHLTPSYLSRLFKRETNQSLVKYLTAYRMDKAAEMLRTTNLKIVEIGEQVGYSGLSYFCMLFKNYFGDSPASFREKDGGGRG